MNGNRATLQRKHFGTSFRDVILYQQNTQARQLRDAVTKNRSRPMPKCEIYKDMKDQWRWRLTKKNGEIEEYSKNGFETREECEKDGKENGNCTSYKRV